jgi:hypothetical protein
MHTEGRATNRLKKLPPHAVISAYSQANLLVRGLFVVLVRSDQTIAHLSTDQRSAGGI